MERSCTVQGYTGHSFTVQYSKIPSCTVPIFFGSTLRDTSLSEVDGEKPEWWDDFLNSIKRELQLAGCSQDVIGRTFQRN